MKFCYITMPFFTLFLLFFPHVRGSVTSDCTYTIKYVITHPLQSAIEGGKIGAKGFVALYSGYLAGKKFLKCFRYLKNNGVKLDVEFLKSPFKTALIAAGLAMVSIECSNSIIDDLKRL